MMQHFRLLAWFAVLANLICLVEPARAEGQSSTIDITTFTCQEHTDTYDGGPKSNEYTSDRQVYFMIWLAGHEYPAKQGIDAEEVSTLAAGVLKICDNNPALKVAEAFKKAANNVIPSTSSQTEDAQFPCFLINAVSTSDGDNYELKTLVAWLSGQSAGRANETVFDFEKFKKVTSGAFAFCSEAKNKDSDIGSAIQALRE